MCSFGKLEPLAKVTLAWALVTEIDGPVSVVGKRQLAVGSWRVESSWACRYDLAM